MTIEQGLRANYEGKVLARALRAVKEQGRKGKKWVSLFLSFIWEDSKEGFGYWYVIINYPNNPNPDQHLPKDYIDVDDEDVSLISEANNQETLDAPIKNTTENSPWISVEDKLPEHENNVLAVLDGEVCVMALINIMEDGVELRVWGYVYDGINGDAIYDDNYKPTHWTEIPKPPQL